MIEEYQVNKYFVIAAQFSCSQLFLLHDYISATFFERRKIYLSNKIDNSFTNSVTPRTVSSKVH